MTVCKKPKQNMEFYIRSTQNYDMNDMNTRKIKAKANKQKFRLNCLTKSQYLTTTENKKSTK